jgi:hypothetical protein
MEAEPAELLTKEGIPLSAVPNSLTSLWYIVVICW